MTLHPIISEQFDGDIWRMEIDELTDTIFVEIRDSAEKKVSFGAVDMRTGKTLFKNLAAPECWLVGIEAAHNGVLLLHFYESDNSPVHKGVMAVDAVTGETLWSNFAWTFDHLSTDGPVLHDARLQPRKLFLADIKTGTPLPGHELSNALRNNIMVPELKQAGDLPFELREMPYGNLVHYLEYDNWRIVSLHAQKNDKLNQLLHVFDGANPDDCGEVYSDLLNSAIQKMQPEAFVMDKNHLIYIKNRSELIVLAL